MHRHRQADSILAPETFDRVETRLPPRATSSIWSLSRMHALIPTFTALIGSAGRSLRPTFETHGRSSSSPFSRASFSATSPVTAARARSLCPLGSKAWPWRRRCKPGAWAACCCDTPWRSHNAAARARRSRSRWPIEARDGSSVIEASKKQAVLPRIMTASTTAFACNVNYERALGGGSPALRIRLSVLDCAYERV